MADGPTFHQSPGPWRVSREFHRTIVQAANGEGVCTWARWPPDSCSDGDLALIVAAPEMADMLRRLEWRENSGGGDATPLDYCGICGGTLRHRPNCELEALLARLPNGGA